MIKERSREATKKRADGFVHWSDVRNQFLDDEERVKNDVFIKLISKLVMRRKDLKLTQEVVAKRVNITQANLARIEKGDAVPRLDTFYKLIMVLEMEFKLLPKETEDHQYEKDL